MPTLKVETTNTWQIVATTSQAFILENASSYNVQVNFNTALPSVDAAYHTLKAGEAILRMGLTGNVYVRGSEGDLGLAFVIVTT